MPKDRRADGACRETDGVDRERFQCADQWIGMGEVEFREYQAGDSAVEEEVVPLDGGAHGAGNHGPAKLRLMLLLAELVFLQCRLCRDARHGVPFRSGQ